MRNERGQFTIEALLIMTVLFGVMLAVTKQAQEKEWMKAFVQGPWKPVQGMIEDGVWIAAGPNSKQRHPLKRNRAGSYQGEDAP